MKILPMFIRIWKWVQCLLACTLGCMNCVPGHGGHEWKLNNTSCVLPHVHTSCPCMFCLSNRFSASPFQMVFFCVYLPRFRVLPTSVSILSSFSEQLSVFALFLPCFWVQGRNQSFVSHASAITGFPNKNYFLRIITFAS